MDKEINVFDFIEKYNKEEKERLERISEIVRKNPMCESCSQSFPGCCACGKL